jgi:[ribosomal protein S18]-alanine N-acetyltransferase
MGQFEIVSGREEYIADILKLADEGGLSPWTEEDYKAELLREDSIFLLILERITDRPAGFILTRLITNENHNNPSHADILNITIHAKIQKRGLGTALLQATINKIAKQSPAVIWLEVRCSNTVAIAFYENNGFTSEYVRKNFYSSPVEDAFVMKMVV